MYRSWNRFFWNRLKFWCGICFIPKVWCYLVGTLHVSLTTVQDHNHNHNHSEQRKQIIGILWWLVRDRLGSCWAGERGGPSAAVQRLLWAGDQWLWSTSILKVLCDVFPKIWSPATSNFVFLNTAFRPKWNIYMFNVDRLKLIFIKKNWLLRWDIFQCFCPGRESFMGNICSEMP